MRTRKKNHLLHLSFFHILVSFSRNLYRMIISACEEVLLSQRTPLLLCFLKMKSLTPPPQFSLIQTGNCYYISPQSS